MKKNKLLNAIFKKLKINKNDKINKLLIDFFNSENHKNKSDYQEFYNIFNTVELIFDFNTILSFLFEAAKKTDVFIDQMNSDKLIDLLDSNNIDFLEELQKYLSGCYYMSNEKTKTNLQLPEIQKENSVNPANSAIIMPVYVGDYYKQTSLGNLYMNTLNFDHPYPLRSDETGVLDYKDLYFLDAINNFNEILNSKYQCLPKNFKYPVYVVIGSTKKEINKEAYDWISGLINKNCRLENLNVKYITQHFFDKIFNELIFSKIENCETDVRDYIKNIYSAGLCSYPNIRNFSELFVAAEILTIYPDNLCGLIEIDEDQLIEKNYCELLKDNGETFLGLGLNGLGSLLKNGKTITIQAGEYYQYNPNIPIKKSISLSDVAPDKQDLSFNMFYQKNNLYRKSIDYIYKIDKKNSRHPSARGGLIFSLANSIIQGNSFCFDKITRGEDTARLISIYGETQEELRYIPLLKMAHNQSKKLKQLMNISGNDVAAADKTFVADLKRWLIKSALLNYYKNKGNNNIYKNFTPYPAGMLDNTECRVHLTMLLKILLEPLKESKLRLLNSWFEVFRYYNANQITNNYTLFLKSMSIISAIIKKDRAVIKI
ncbi:hypothetical protein KA977_05940 [Candidatus Dependentiae bacterium]|nr:hypothetical protein [Candidatus Dependentiae bacterium]